MVTGLVVLPLLGSRTPAVAGWGIGHKGAGLVTTGLVGCSWLMSLMRFGEVMLGDVEKIVVSRVPWRKGGGLDVSWGFLVDSLTATMLVVVTSISLLVHLYSTEYMAEDPHLPRFMSYLSLFTFFMLILVTGDNLMQLFLGWEGVGLCSYLLISFWYTRLQANKAAIKAMLVNRVGDLGLARGMACLYMQCGSLDYETIFAVAPTLVGTTSSLMGFSIDTLTLIGLLLVIGAAGKSAQLGLHTWLPDAMEAPTPVSALIHAATMVTAGVFLLARMSPRLEYSPRTMTVVTVLGGMTLPAPALP